MNPPKFIPFEEHTPTNQERLLEYYAEATRIDNDPAILAEHKKWLAIKPWPPGVSPIMIAKHDAYSRICLGDMVAKEWRDKFFHK